jgi:hypothetical protein
MKGLGTKLIDQSFTGNDVAHFLGAHESSEPLMNKGVSLNQVKDAGNRAKHFFGLGARKAGRPKKVRADSPERARGKCGSSKGFKRHRRFLRPVGSAIVHECMPAAGGLWAE